MDKLILIKHCKSYGFNPKFDIHNDQIYYLDSGFRTSVHVVDLNGNCIRTKQIDHQYYECIGLLT